MDRILEAGRSRQPRNRIRATLLAGTLGCAGLALAGGMGGAAGGGTAGDGSGAAGVQGAPGPAGRASDAAGGFEGGADRDATAGTPDAGPRGAAPGRVMPPPGTDGDIDRSEGPAGDTTHTFKGADADRDNRLSAEEFGDFRRRNEAVPADADLAVSDENERLFEDLDRDGDGRLSAEEAIRRGGE